MWQKNLHQYVRNEIVFTMAPFIVHLVKCALSWALETDLCPPILYFSYVPTVGIYVSIYISAVGRSKRGWKQRRHARASLRQPRSGFDRRSGRDTSSSVGQHVWQRG
jgi:hypothetical protein